jgi:hypothetical protein
MLLFVGWIIYTVHVPIASILIVALMISILQAFLVGPFYLLIGIFLTVIYVRINGMYWIGTKDLRVIWSDIEGYRIYIKQVVLRTIRFENKELKTTSTERDFAYALVLEMSLDWKSRFTL